MAELLLKLLVCPIVVLLVDILSGDVDYQAVYQPLAVGLFIAVAGRFMEYFSLKAKTLVISVWISSVIDFVIAFAVVYFSQYLYLGSRITFFGALVTALMIAVTEYFQHVIFLSRSLREKDGPH
jgi:hypothetical protein